MIRIDEIYNNTIWPFIHTRIPLTRLFFCDPPGRTDVDALFNHGEDKEESNYIFLHDQEPIHLDIHQPLFDEIVVRNLDLNNKTGATHKAIITSELDSEYVEQVCSHYGWTPYYYFFHGWASLDWYRGYDKTYLITDPAQRTVTQTFIAPNRIVAGKRQHRLAMLYYIFKHSMTNNWVSCPEVCPAENISVHDAVKSLKDTYPDIAEVFAAQQLPRDFPGETDHPMHSCWLSLFEQVEDSLLYLVTETVATGRRLHLTEKTFKPIAHGIPFVIVGTCGSLKYLRSYGFQTFGDFWDESYDDEVDDEKRIEKIAHVLKQLNNLDTASKNHLFHRTHDVVAHNWNHFYNGGFEKILWQELTTMLDAIQRDFNT
jgi:hypothetical protein